MKKQEIIVHDQEENQPIETEMTTVIQLTGKDIKCAIKICSICSAFIKK